MTRHIFKLVWNRKRSTGLILLEIFICFLVLCAIMTAAIGLGGRYGKPLGFDYQDVWAVSVEGINWQAEEEEGIRDRESMKRILTALKGLPEVQETAVSTNLPFHNSTWMNTTFIKGQRRGVEMVMMSEDLPRVLDLELLYGRWVNEEDGALEYRPVVINQRFARGLFGLDDAVGKDMPFFDENGKITSPEEDATINRVVGVMSDFRRHGMTREDPLCMFMCLDMNEGTNTATEILVRVRPGTTAAFEERMIETMQQVNPAWTYGTGSLENSRKSMLTAYLAPMIAQLVVATFLIIMVGLGLVGVLWLGVTRRTSELGLRRALGASAVSVRWQILGELWALTGLAVTVGAVVFLQLPIFGANFGVGWPVFLGGTLLAAGVLYAFVTFCGLYPTWLATRVLPATALQYE